MEENKEASEYYEDFKQDMVCFWLLAFLLLWVIIKIVGVPLFATFVLLKAYNVVSWSWAIVFIPLMVWGVVAIVDFIFRLID